MKKLLLTTLATLLITTVHAQPINVAEPTAYARTALSPLGIQKIFTAVTISSGHYYEITNETTKPQTFYWKLSLCPTTQPQMCVYKSDHLTLMPGQRYKKNELLQQTVVFRAIGSKSIVAETHITGAKEAYSVQQAYVDIIY